MCPKWRHHTNQTKAPGRSRAFPPHQPAWSYPNKQEHRNLPGKSIKTYSKRNVCEPARKKRPAEVATVLGGTTDSFNSGPVKKQKIERSSWSNQESKSSALHKTQSNGMYCFLCLLSRIQSQGQHLWHIIPCPAYPLVHKLDLPIFTYI